MEERWEHADSESSLSNSSNSGLFRYLRLSVQKNGVLRGFPTFSFWARGRDFLEFYKFLAMIREIIL